MPELPEPETTEQKYAAALLKELRGVRDELKKLNRLGKRKDRAQPKGTKKLRS